MRNVESSRHQIRGMKTDEKSKALEGEKKREDKYKKGDANEG
jgi:hypothetical protein